jgi:hypothetical protein
MQHRWKHVWRLSLALALLCAACGGRFTVAPQPDIPNPDIGGIIYGPVQP